MKKVLFFAGFLFATAALGAAAETVFLETPQHPVEMEKNLGSESFGFMVHRDGSLVASPAQVFTQGGNYEGIQLPYLISTPTKIFYPKWAVRQGWEGTLEIALEIRQDGSVGRTKVMKSTGHHILDKAAEAAIKGWKFQPAMKNGKPIAECIQIPVHFELDDKGSSSIE